MKDRYVNLRVFLTALFGTAAGILPAAGCTGACGPCVGCAGAGGILAVLAALGWARKTRQGEGSWSG